MIFRVHQHNLLYRILLVAQIDHRDAFRHADLRRRQANPIAVYMD